MQKKGKTGKKTVTFTINKKKTKAITKINELQNGKDHKSPEYQSPNEKTKGTIIVKDPNINNNARTIAIEDVSENKSGETIDLAYIPEAGKSGETIDLVCIPENIKTKETIDLAYVPEESKTGETIDIVGMPKEDTLQKTIDLEGDAEASIKTVDIEVEASAKTLDIPHSDTSADTIDVDYVPNKSGTIDLLNVERRETDAEQNLKITVLEPEKFLLHYEIKSKIGEGAMGQVYVGIDTTLKRKVAIKTLHPGLAADYKLTERFKREAQALAQIRHPNVVQVHGLHNDRGIYFFVMEYIPSQQSLEDILKTKKYLDEKEAVHIMKQISEGLYAIHKAGIIHRDIKPANIMIEKGVTKIADFGIVLWNETQARGSIGGVSSPSSTSPNLTNQGIIGTPFYLAPECFKGQKANETTDIYAMGIILYEMLSGHKPFMGTTIQEVINDKLVKSPPPLRDLKKDISVELAKIVNKMINKNPEERFQNVQEVLHALNKVIKTQENKKALEKQKTMGKELATIMTKNMQSQARSSQRQIWIAVSFVAMIIALLVLVGNSMTNSKITYMKVPGNAINDIVWTEKKWGRTSGVIVEITQGKSKDQSGYWVTIDNYNKDTLVFVPDNIYAAYPEIAEENFVAFQGKVKKDKKKIYITVEKNGLIPWQEASIFVREKTLKNIKKLEDKHLDKTGGIKGSVIYRKLTSKGLWAILEMGAKYVGVDIHASGKMSRKYLGDKIRIGDVIEAHGTIGKHDKTEQTEEMYYFDVHPEKKTHWFTVKSVALKVRVELK